MSELAHTPYAGSRTPFSIGLARLDLSDWIEPDERLAAYLAEKRRLFAQKRDGVFGEEADTRDAQAEVLALLADYLPKRFPQTYVREADHIAISGTQEAVDLDRADAPLATASFLVQEDLVLMRPGPEGYRLVAASLCFPSSWSLAEKFGKPMRAIHDPVPHWAGKMGTLVDRIFDKLKVDQPVWRLNWSIYPDAELHHPESKGAPRDWFSGSLPPRAFVRVERQTLRRLPVSGDILFTIKVCVDPFEALGRHPDGARLAAGLREQILSLDEAQLTYKAMLAHRDRIVEALDKIAPAASV
jgi:Haem-dependent oxidative N-demethylase, alpha subunit-like